MNQPDTVLKPFFEKSGTAAKGEAKYNSEPVYCSAPHIPQGGYGNDLADDIIARGDAEAWSAGRGESRSSVSYFRWEPRRISSRYGRARSVAAGRFPDGQRCCITRLSNKIPHPPNRRGMRHIIVSRNNRIGSRSLSSSSGQTPAESRSAYRPGRQNPNLHPYPGS